MGLWGGRSAGRCGETVGRGQDTEIREKEDGGLDNGVRARLKDGGERERKARKARRRTGRERQGREERKEEGQKQGKTGESASPVGRRAERGERGSASG